jgi:hypothetical protein
LSEAGAWVYAVGESRAIEAGAGKFLNSTKIILKNAEHSLTKVGTAFFVFLGVFDHSWKGVKIFRNEEPLPKR